ncbi:MAG: MarP family serine protease [Solirubrobacterales bacterium]|nr:MarP family serine protease [Solirubrobacterales bacterium]
MAIHGRTLPSPPTEPVTTLDVIIIVFTLLMAGYGYLQGFIVGALSLAGFALGAFLGARVGPLLLPDRAHSPYAPVFGLLGAVVAGGILATGFESIGAKVRRAVRLPGLGTVDGALGAVLTGCVALGIAWIGGAVALQTPGARTLRRDVQRSFVLRHLNDVLPPSGAILNALARVDPLPAIVGPNAQVPAPRAAIARDPQVAAAAGSVVRVIGTACGLGVEGSGWVAGPGTVVTNAHVVAGESDTSIEIRGLAPDLRARVVLFDPHNDVAVLRVDGVSVRSLPVASNPRTGTSAAILGFPENGPYSVRAARIGTEQDVISDDAYGRGPIRRKILPFRGVVKPGNSGGPLVDGQGRVVGTVFASTRGAAGNGGLAVPDDVVQGDLRSAGNRSVSTQGCTG